MTTITCSYKDPINFVTLSNNHNTFLATNGILKLLMKNWNKEQNFTDVYYCKALNDN